MEKNTKRNLLTVGAIASIVALGGTVGANAASQVTSADIKDQTIQSRDIAADGVGKSEIRTGAVGSLEILNQSIQSYDIDAEAVGTSEIRNNTIRLEDINDSTEKALRGNEGPKGDTGATGEQGPQGPAGEDGKDGADGKDGKDGTFAGVQHAEGAANVEKIGGPFSTNATFVEDLTLLPGTYVVTTDAFFIAKEGSEPTGKADLMVAVRGVSENEVDLDLGTGFTGDSPQQAKREVTTSTTRLVTLDETTSVSIKVFGYETDGQGSADSGVFDAKVNIVAIPVTLAD